VKRQERGSDHPSPSSAEDKNVRTIPAHPHAPSRHSAQLQNNMIGEIKLENCQNIQKCFKGLEIAYFAVKE
jgi:hypothetical protein